MERKKPGARLRKDSGHHRRILGAAALLGLAAFLPVALRLGQLMVADHGYYSRLALDNQTRTTQVAAHRGTIYDRNGNVLAASRSVQVLYLDPRELQQSGADTEKLSRWLGGLLGLDSQAILKKAQNLKVRYERVAGDLDGETAGRIREYILQEGIVGVHLEPGSRRVYPYGTLAAQVLGFTNRSGQGSEGLEAAYNSFLEGPPGRVITTKGNNEMDMPYSYEAYLGGQEGCSLVLTLDVTVQACLEKQMAAAIDRYGVQNGAFGLVMDVNTGEILAMATLGSFDPNAYLEIYDDSARQALEQLREDPQLYSSALDSARLKQWRNRCISDGYEPGSTFKVLTLAAALDCGAVDLNTAFHCGGAEQIPGRSQLLHCWRSAGHGSQQTPQALQNSCNLAFAHIALKLGGDRFYDYITRFGILEKTGIDLYGESRGVFFDKALVTDTDKWGTASLTSGSFGQTFKLTPLQLVRAIASVVNGGRLLEPYLVSQVLDADGKVVLQQEPTVVRQTVSPETSRTMCALIRSVVTDGTAKNAAVSGYDIGGKTGTSEKIDVFDAQGQRVLDKIVSFVGIAPMNDPRYIVLVALDTPSRQTGMYISGGVMAAPTVGAVLGDILPYLEVERAPVPEVTVPDLGPMTPREAETTLKKLGLTAVFAGEGDVIFSQLPTPGSSAPVGGQVLVYLQTDTKEQENETD